jgi:hypothetical protein
MAESKYRSRKIVAPLLSEESATDQVVEILDYYDVDVELLTGGNDEQSAALEKSLDKVRDAIRHGKLEVTRDAKERLVVVQHLEGGEKLEYKEINAAAKLAADKVPSGHNYARVYAFMGSLAGVGRAGIEKLPTRDLGITECLGTVFLNA